MVTVFPRGCCARGARAWRRGCHSCRQAQNRSTLPPHLYRLILVSVQHCGAALSHGRGGAADGLQGRGVQGRGRRSGQQVVARGSGGTAATGGDRRQAPAPFLTGLGEGAAAVWGVAAVLGGLAGMAAGSRGAKRGGSASSSVESGGGVPCVSAADVVKCPEKCTWALLCCAHVFHTSRPENHSALHSTPPCPLCSHCKFDTVRRRQSLALLSAPKPTKASSLAAQQRQRGLRSTQ